MMLSITRSATFATAANKLTGRLLRNTSVKAINPLQGDSSSSNSGIRNYETVAITKPSKYVAHVELNRPQKANAMNQQFWKEIGECFDELNEDSSCRSIVLSGAGKLFSSGIDLGDLGALMEVIQGDEDVARKCRKMYKAVVGYQNSFTSLEKCRKPVIAAVHSACVGAGVDLICGADIRYCTTDAWYQIKEVDIGLAADVGTLQRLPKIVGNESLVRELAFSARKMFADEALKLGLVSRIFPDKTSMIDSAVELATTIAKKSPVAVQGTKIHLIYSRDHSVQESLEYQASWNQSMLLSEDLTKSAMAQISKTDVEFSDL